jgi:hypothetical protein
MPDTLWCIGMSIEPFGIISDAMPCSRSQPANQKLSINSVKEKKYRKVI